ncbi:MAG: ankyrin repeat domain-containing protein [Gemmatimonadaceae bacterium]
MPDRGPPLGKEKVEAFVRAGHSDLAKVKEMLAAQPSIVNASWDWGGGDYETALGGASHMGRRDIAEVLLAAGARLDLFAAAALGKLYIVQAAAAVFEDILKVPGPHGISLLAHAQKGGSTEVVTFINDFLKPPPAWLNSPPSPKPGG